MGWLLKTKITKSQDPKYKFWSTVVDADINEEWLTRDEILNFLFWERFRSFIKKFMEDSHRFPSSWTLKETDTIIIDQKREDSYKDFLHRISDDESVMWKEFLKLLIEKGIKLNVQDSKYHVYTPPKPRSTFKSAVKRVMKKLKGDKEYRHTWMCNISMSYQDAVRDYMKEYKKRSLSQEDLKKIADIGANKFLDLFTDTLKAPKGR